MKNLIVSVILIIAISFAINAQPVSYTKYGIDYQSGLIPAGLKQGDKAPDFSGYDQKGTRVNSKKILESGPIVLFFYMGKWSSICSKYLSNYQDSLNILTGMGVNVVAITPESVENVEQTVKMHNLTYTVIYDCQEQIMKDYNVMYNVTKAYQDSVLQHGSTDIARNNGRDAAHLPVPATYIINRDGIITGVYFNPDYHDRASVKWVINNLASAL